MTTSTSVPDPRRWWALSLRLVLPATTAWLPRGARQRGTIDLAGAFTVTSALALSVYAIVTANEPGSGARTGVLLAISGALFATFVV